MQGQRRVNNCVEAIEGAGTVTLELVNGSDESWICRVTASPLQARAFWRSFPRQTPRCGFRRQLTWPNDASLWSLTTTIASTESGRSD